MIEKVRRVDYSPDEMIAGVAGKITPFDFGVYWMVCTLIYSRGGPIDNDHVWLANLFTDTHWRAMRASLDRLIAVDKIDLLEGQLMVKRCASELQDARKRIASYQQRGRKGGRPRNENNDLEKAGVSAAQKPTINHQPPTNKVDSEPSIDTELKNPDSEPSGERGAQSAHNLDPGPIPDFLIRQANGSTGYAWGGQVIKLNVLQLETWRGSYSNIPDLEAELQKADDYYTDHPPKGGKWFFAVSRWLEKAHGDAAPPAKDPRTDPEFWKEGEDDAG